MRLIDADALFIAISESVAHRIAHSDDSQFGVGRTIGLISAREIVKNAPTIDTVRRGQWVDHADSYLCSACGLEVGNPDKCEYGAGVCPSCCAKMAKEESV